MESDQESFRFAVDQLEDAEWLCALVRRTERKLPAPKPKKKNKTTRKNNR